MGSMPSRRTRARVTNGAALPADVDGRSALARRFRDLLGEIISDLGGAEAGLSESQRQLARRIATLSAACEQMEAAMAGGERIDLEVYQRLTNTLGRACQRLGIKRQPREVGSCSDGRSIQTEVRPGLMSLAEIEGLSDKALEQLIAAQEANVVYLQGRIAELKGASADADGRPLRCHGDQ
jgi:hypothetical protein